MKVYARQMNPEYQESPLMIWGWEDCYDGLIAYGNKEYRGHVTKEFQQMLDYFEDMCSDWQDDGYCYTRIDGTWNYEKHSKKHEYSVKEMLWKWGVSRPDGKPWNNKQKHEWKEFMEGGFDCRDEDCICEGLRLLTGYEWKHTVIRGCCQGDWEGIYYRTNLWDKESLERFEAEYFNTGTEWMIHDEDEEPESPEDISGFTVYCTSWNDEGMRKEIADAAGCEPEDVVMFAWDGVYRSDKYRLIV